MGMPVGITPNANCASTSGVPPFRGMLAIWRELTTCPVEAVAVSTWAASDVTVMLSVAEPTSS